MKKLYIILVLFLAACATGPSEDDVQTAIAKTQAAEPTQTPSPTSSPTLTSTSTIQPTNTPRPTNTTPPTPISVRETAFSSTFSELRDYLLSFNFNDGISSNCFLDNTPIWTECENFTYFFRDEASQSIQIMHDDESVVGIFVVFLPGIAEKYPDEVTTAIGMLEFLLAQGLPAATILGGSEVPTRFDDFVYFEGSLSEGKIYVWLDIAIAEEIYD
ncbi:MAG: hypothetical protein FVQ83_10680 [Chloroflexi bacterium]|nr:hypothetical protein [Chloroflexota bacterium]